MIGAMLIIFILLPETPWWLASKGKLDKAKKVLLKYNGHLEGYNAQEVIVSSRSSFPYHPTYLLERFVQTNSESQDIMTATIEEERVTAERESQHGQWAVFQGQNLVRFFIAAWPKVTQQFVGLSVFNTYSTYFCEPLHI